MLSLWVYKLSHILWLFFLYLHFIINLVWSSGYLAYLSVNWLVSPALVSYLVCHYLQSLSLGLIQLTWSVSNYFSTVVFSVKMEGQPFITTFTLSNFLYV
jgi:hypothetical protein